MMPKRQRASGLLLHLTSLPSPYGIGDFGPSAYQFVDFLKASGQSVWQILPLTPTSPFLGNSPYSGYSAFAGNFILISPELLQKEGRLSAKDLEDYPSLPEEKVDYESVMRLKTIILEKAYLKVKSELSHHHDFQRFCQENTSWLDDFSLYQTLKNRLEGKPWYQWPEELKNRNRSALQKIRKEYQDLIEKSQFIQYLFFKQWFQLKEYCQKSGVRFLGDVPIYVDHDSADVWSHPDFFQLDEKKGLIYVAGVPPDYFSTTGQRWGNPVYDWAMLKETAFDWWMKRLSHNLRCYDCIRIDHFRGLVSYWAIPAEEPTAVHGHWEEVPREEFFDTIMNQFPNAPIIAEDLGIITPDVTAVMEKYGFPGMKVLLFAFGGELEKHPYLPENFPVNCVAYTGTHDNNTVQGWLQNDTTKKEKQNLSHYLKDKFKPSQLQDVFMQILFNSNAGLVIIPLQDVLGLGQEARMNIPGLVGNNWQWRTLKKHWKPSLSEKLLKMTKAANR